MGMSTYKNFIKLLEQNNINNLNELPIKSIYRKLKRDIDSNFYIKRVKQISGHLIITGHNNKDTGLWVWITKETWKIEERYIKLKF